MKITIRPNRLTDAKRFYEILNSPEFKYFGKGPESIKAEEKIIKKMQQQRKKRIHFTFAILADGKIVGGCGVRVSSAPARKHAGEIGYFLDPAFWNKGIATKAVKLLEKFAFAKLKLKRIEIVMVTPHKASERVAIKAGYEKEATFKKYIHNRDGKFYDAHVYSKIK
ncbi:MAG TPA: GNAT family protein [Candidatus Gracilibacteria bacterium]|nr:GNAT family N-acetyltransferase [Candidatus Gracilibacteria bacterium]HRY90891.1 GNAT family protein [Candidatus Gracilibacteria bacterium]